MYYKLAPIAHVLSRLGFVFSLLLLAPTFVSYLYQDAAFWVFADTAAATICASGIIWLITRSHQRELRTRDGFTLVFLLWLGFAVVASLPFYWYLPGISYTDAFFEAISGLTTAGATVFTNLDSFPPSLNFWRHLLNWVGGMGIIVLAVAILPMIGVGGTQLFKAEIPGIHKDSKLAPRISQTAKNLWLIYVFFTLITCLALRLAGMSWLDAVCHAMSCLGLGGFSTHDQNIAYFDSVPIEMILSVGSVIAAINFTNHYYAFRPDYQHHRVRPLPVAQRFLPRLVAIPALRRFQLHLHRPGQRLRQHRLRRLAAARFPLDVFPRQHPLQRRQCRRRAQNHPRHRLV